MGIDIHEIERKIVWMDIKNEMVISRELTLLVGYFFTHAGISMGAFF